MGDHELAAGLVEQRKDDVVARAAQDVVAASATAHQVIGRPSVDEVVARVAIDGVGAGMAPDAVCACARRDDVIATLAVDAVDVVAGADGVVATLGLAVQDDRARNARAARQRRRCGVGRCRDQAFVAQDEVGTQAASQHVMAEPADDVVITAAAIDGVVAALAVQDVAAQATEDHVATVGQVGRRRDQAEGAFRRAHRAVGVADDAAGAPQATVTTEHDIVAIAGVHGVDAEAGDDVVGAEPAGDGVVATLGKDPVVTGAAHDDVATVCNGLRATRDFGLEQHIAPEAAHGTGSQRTARQHDRAAVGQDDVAVIATVDAVVAGAADDVVVADTPGDDVAGRAAVDEVAAGFAVDGVPVGAAIQAIVVGATPQDVNARTAPHLVVAVAGKDGVVAVARIDRVTARTRCDGVGVVAGPDLVSAGAGGDDVHAGMAVDDVGAIACRDGVVALAAEDAVIARAGGDGVVAADQAAVGVFDLADGAPQVGEHPAVADEHVVAARIGDLVVAAATEHDVGPAAGGDDVVAVAKGRAGAQHAVLDAAFITEHDVHAATGVDGVVTGLAVDRVVAGAGGDVVAAEAATDGGRPGGGAQRDGVVACATVDLVGDGAVGDAGQVDDVIALARRDDDLADPRITLLEGDAAEGRTHDHLVRRPALRDGETLAEVDRVVVLPLRGEFTHVDLQHTVADVAGQRGHAGERDLEVHQRDRWRDVEFLLDLEQEQVDLEEGEQLGVQLAGDVEHGQRRQRRLAVLHLVEHVVDNLGDAHAPVMVVVEEIEEDIGKDAAGHAGARHAQVELGGGRQATAESDLRNVCPAAVRVGGVADVEAVKDEGRVPEAAVGKLLDA